MGSLVTPSTTAVTNATGPDVTSLDKCLVSWDSFILISTTNPHTFLVVNTSSVLGMHTRNGEGFLISHQTEKNTLCKVAKADILVLSLFFKAFSPYLIYTEFSAIVLEILNLARSKKHD